MGSVRVCQYPTKYILIFFRNNKKIQEIRARKNQAYATKSINCFVGVKAVRRRMSFLWAFGKATDRELIFFNDKAKSKTKELGWQSMQR